MNFLSKLKTKLGKSDEDIGDYPKDDIVPYSEQIQRMRTAMNLTQGEFGNRLDIPMTLIQAWERGTIFPKPAEIKYVTDKCVDDYANMANTAWGARPITREQIVDPEFHLGVYTGASKGLEREIPDVGTDMTDEQEAEFHM